MTTTMDEFLSMLFMNKNVSLSEQNHDISNRTDGRVHHLLEEFCSSMTVDPVWVSRDIVELFDNVVEEIDSHFHQRKQFRLQSFYLSPLFHPFVNFTRDINLDFKSFGDALFNLVICAFRGWLYQFNSIHGFPSVRDPFCISSVSVDEENNHDSTPLELESLEKLIHSLSRVHCGFLARRGLGLRNFSLCAMRAIVSDTCRGRFSESFSPLIDIWSRTCGAAFLEAIESTNWTLSSWRDPPEELIRVVADILWTFLGRLRLSEFFDIALEYPESRPAAFDLKYCLTSSSKVTHSLVQSVLQVFEQRLMHPAAPTQIILDQYIATINILRLIDPTNISLEHINKPIHAYLRTRPDAINCIVSSLVEKEDSVLYQELSRSATARSLVRLSASAIRGDLEFDFDMSRDVVWRPRPRVPDTSLDAPDEEPDIMGALVAIYGSTKYFAREYKKILSQHLLRLSDYSTEHERRVLELLKLRFGEKRLHSCEIMLKDIAESKRIHTNLMDKFQARRQRVANALGGISPESIHTVIVSHLFWPKISQEAPFVPHESIKAILDGYSVHFQSLKAPRRLIWMHSLSSIDVDVTFPNGQTLSVRAPPLDVSFLLYVQEKGPLSLDELIALLQTTKKRAQYSLLSWARLHVLTVSEGFIYLSSSRSSESLSRSTSSILQASSTEQGSLSVLPSSVGINSSEIFGSSSRSSPTQWNRPRQSLSPVLNSSMDNSSPPLVRRSPTPDASALSVADFIRGILRNFRSLSLTRIRSFLSMFMASRSEGVAESLLQRVIQDLIEDGELQEVTQDEFALTNANQ